MVKSFLASRKKQTDAEVKEGRLLKSSSLEKTEGLERLGDVEEVT